MSQAPHLDRPITKAILVYRIDAALALLPAAGLVAYGMYEGSAGAIVLLTLLAAVPGLVGAAALLVATGLRARATARVLRGAAVVQKMFALCTAGMFVVAGRMVKSMFGDFYGSAAGGFAVLAFLAAVATLTWFSFRTLRHPVVYDHLGLDRTTGRPLAG